MNYIKDQDNCQSYLKLTIIKVSFLVLVFYNKEGGEINILKAYLFLPTDEIASFAYNKEGGEINILKAYLFLPTDEIASFAYNKFEY